MPKAEPDKPDVLGKLYSFLGTYKFANLVEEATAEGVSDMLELGNLLGEMQRTGDILKTRAMRLEGRKRKAVDYDRFWM